MWGAPVTDSEDCVCGHLCRLQADAVWEAALMPRRLKSPGVCPLCPLCPLLFSCGDNRLRQAPGILRL